MHNGICHNGAYFFEQEEEVNITTNSLHPGSIVTNLFRYNGIIRGKLITFHVKTSSYK